MLSLLEAQEEDNKQLEASVLDDFVRAKDEAEA